MWPSFAGADRLASAAAGGMRRIGYELRGLAYRGYDRLAGLNYDRGLLVRRNRTPAGTFRCYEPLNRHDDDAMLAEIDAACGADAVVYDVGANVGVYTLALASGASERRIVAFEPAPATVERLRANVRLNDLADRIDVRACGVGDRSGERPFYLSTHPELSGFERTSATRWEAGVREIRPVPVVRLDDLDGEVPAPDAIKIDVEGAAPAVVRGAQETLSAHGPTVFVEVHDDGLPDKESDELRSVLDDAGYDIRERNGYWRCEPR